jgi:hypothetical protein
MRLAALPLAMPPVPYHGVGEVASPAARPGHPD